MNRLLQFKTRSVRELAWVLLSPPLLECQLAPLESATEAWGRSHFDAFEPELRTLDQDPSALQHYLEQGKSIRLGKHFENLLAFWFDKCPRYELLERNLQIRDSKQTYGELDFVVRDLERQCVLHWEVAIKFYLQVGPEQALDSWLGPNLRDDLGRKTGHLIQHQLRRALHPVARELLAQKGIVVDQSFLMMKGHLFHADVPEHHAQACKPDSESMHQGVALHRGHLAAWWRSASDFDERALAGGLHWRVLTKPNWLVDQSGLDFDEPAPPLMDLLAICRRGPTYVVGLQDSMEVERGFVVPDNWLGADAATRVR